VGEVVGSVYGLHAAAWRANEDGAVGRRLVCL
jgi:hypothetical protein